MYLNTKVKTEWNEYQNGKSNKSERFWKELRKSSVENGRMSKKSYFADGKSSNQFNRSMIEMLERDGTIYWFFIQQTEKSIPFRRDQQVNKCLFFFFFSFFFSAHLDLYSVCLPKTIRTIIIKLIKRPM